MSELTNYSIETDQVVLLSFKDGRSLRVPLKHLSRYIKGGDLDKIKKSVNLRRHFLRIHMPRLFIMLAAVGGLVALLSLGGKTVAGLFSRPHAPATAPSRTGIARSQINPTPVLSPNVKSAESDSRLTQTTKTMLKSKTHALARTTSNAVQAVTTTAQATAQLTSQSAATPLDSSQPGSNPVVPVQTDNSTGQAPATTPTPSPIPAPTASPSPTPAPQGQVLGDATSPTN